ERYRDLERPPELDDPPQRTRRHVAQDRPRPTRENSSDEEALSREVRSVHRVYAGPDLVEATVRESRLYRVRTEAEGEQLDARDHPMLAPRKPPRCRLRIFGRHSTQSAQSMGFAPRRPRGIRVRRDESACARRGRDYRDGGLRR